jgi:hypothetical protein
VRRLLVLCAVLLIAAACSSGDDDSDVATRDATSTTAAGAVTTVVGETTVAGSSGGGSGTTRAPTKAAGPTAPSGTPAPPPAQAGTKFPAAGKYNYRVTGTANNQPIDFTSVLTISPPNGADQNNSQSTPQGTSDQILRYLPDGIFLVSLTVKAGLVSKEFRPDGTALTFPLPPTVNKAWSWSARSTDGKTRVNAAFKLLRTENVTVGGQSLQAWVIEAKTSTTGDFQSTADRVIWISEPLRLVLRTDEKGQSGIGATETSAKLQSTTPS